MKLKNIFEVAPLSSILKNDDVLTDKELLRSIRLAIASEYEAIQLYQQIAESTDNTLVQKVFIDIADEEKIHVGEFLKLLEKLSPEEIEFYEDGKKEVEKM
jgi:rubrerythrin